MTANKNRKTLLAIQKELDGVEWNSDTLERIAAILIEAGYPINDSKRDPGVLQRLDNTDEET